MEPILMLGNMAGPANTLQHLARLSNRGQPTGDQHSNIGERMTEEVEVLIPKEVKVLGVHKRDTPRKSYLFVIAVKWSDDSQMTIYRRLSEIKSLQQKILNDAKNDDQEESKTYLKRMTRQVRNVNKRFFNGTMQKLRMIDSLNSYFEVVTYYKTSAQSSTVREFFRPNSSDLQSTKWSGDGRTFFYVCRDVLGQRNILVDENDPDNFFPEISSTLSSDESIMDDITHEMDFNSLGNLDVPDSNISWPVQSEVFVALCDHIVSDEDHQQNIFDLCKGEEVEILNRNESGWWLVKRLNSDTECGYVPATYIAPKGSVENVDNTENVSEHDNSEIFEEQEERSTSSSASCLSDDDALDDFISDDSLDSPNQEETFPDFEASVSASMSSYDSRMMNILDTVSEHEDSTEESSLTSSSSSEISSIESMSPSPVITRQQSEAIVNFRAKRSPHRRRFMSISPEGAQNFSFKRRTVNMDTSESFRFPKPLNRGMSLPNIGLRTQSRESLASRSSVFGFPSRQEYISNKKYQAQREDELSFGEHAILKVVKKNSDGWWIAIYQGRIGLVPGMYLQKYDDPFRSLGEQLFNLA